VTLVRSVQNTFGRSWKLSSHWTKNVRNFFGSVPSKVSGSRTLVRDEDLDEREDHVSLSIAMERLLKMTRLASSGSGMPSMGSSLPSSGLGRRGRRDHHLRDHRHRDGHHLGHCRDLQQRPQVGDTERGRRLSEWRSLGIGRQSRVST